MRNGNPPTFLARAVTPWGVQWIKGWSAQQRLPVELRTRIVACCGKLATAAQADGLEAVTSALYAFFAAAKWTTLTVVEIEMESPPP